MKTWIVLIIYIAGVFAAYFQIQRWERQGITGSVLVIISQFLNNSKRNARQPGQLSDSCPKILNTSYL